MNKKTIIIIMVLILAVIASIYAVSTKIETKPGLRLDVAVEDYKVTNVTMEQLSLPFFYKQSSGKVVFPDISVNAKLNGMESKPVSYWASESFKGDGKYILTLTFEDASPPNATDILLLPIRVTDMRGHVIYKTTAFYEWK
jgi:hypothetical protein